MPSRLFSHQRRPFTGGKKSTGIGKSVESLLNHFRACRIIKRFQCQTMFIIRVHNSYVSDSDDISLNIMLTLGRIIIIETCKTQTSETRLSAIRNWPKRYGCLCTNGSNWSRQMRIIPYHTVFFISNRSNNSHEFLIIDRLIENEEYDTWFSQQRPATRVH